MLFVGSFPCLFVDVYPWHVPQPHDYHKRFVISFMLEKIKRKGYDSRLNSQIVAYGVDGTSIVGAVKSSVTSPPRSIVPHA